MDGGWIEYLLYCIVGFCGWILSFSFFSFPFLFAAFSLSRSGLTYGMAW